MKIYTKTGDSGETSLLGGKRVRKDHAHVEAYGTVDELNAVLGLANSELSGSDLQSQLSQIQNDLFVAGADLASPTENKSVKSVRMTEEAVGRLEKDIDRMEKDLPPLTQFILPGGSSPGALLHLARTVCRRAERAIVGLAGETYNPLILTYLNRLSDWLFVAARCVNQEKKVSDIPWKSPLK